MALETLTQSRVTTIRINHNAANTLTADSFAGIHETLQKYETDDSTRVVIFTGNDAGYFSNGFEPAYSLINPTNITTKFARW